MNDGFTIELEGDAALQRTLGAAVIGLARPGDLMDRIGAVMERNVQLRFDTKTAPDGTAWLPLAPSTVKSYERKYNGRIPGSLLERTRFMRGSLTHNAFDSFVDVGFTDPKALYHETGTRRGLPRRQLLSDDPIAGTLGAGDREDILAEVAAYLRELF
jgi:phage gpG-like protein